MESTIEYLQHKLREAGPGEWDGIAAAVNKGLDEKYQVTRISLRKIAYGERPNLGAVKSDALRAYFAANERRKAKV